MKVIKNIFLVAAFLALLVGCGSSGGSSDDGYAGDATLEVVNSEESDSDICSIYSTLTTADTWGEDILSGTLAPGYYSTFYTENCDRYYDLKVVFCDGGEIEVDNIFLGCGDTETHTFRNW